MSKIVIKSENLGKMYHIGRTQERHNTLRDAMTSALGAPLRRLRGSKKSVQTNTFWALKDVSFDVLQGDVLGVIGRNGAGKSTLLKILSRITKPTEGRVQIFGRVASLLEVGTGFHSELTGRDNIYLSGSILGMRRTEIERKFDEIVAFAEVEKFLDTPVKRYSSGMYVRLAFAVAAHLDPEILLVDEVLSVGDIAFQQKSLGRMQGIAQSGRTVLFVSHAMDTVRKLCNRCVFLDGGRVVEVGDTDPIISRYLESASTGSSSRWVRGDADRWNERSEFVPMEMALEYEDERPISSIVGSSQKIWVKISGESKLLMPNMIIGFGLYNLDGTLIFESGQVDGAESKWPRLKVGINTLRVALPVSILNAGTYTIELRVALHHVGWIVAPGTGPKVSFDLILDDSDSPYTGHQKRGLIVPTLQWETVE